MVTSFAPNPGLMMQQAAQHFSQGDLTGAEKLLAPLLAMPAAQQNSDLMQLAGLVRFRQNRMAEAVDFLQHSLAAQPRQPHLAFTLGKALANLERRDDAIAAFQNTIRLNPEFLDAYLELGNQYHLAGRLEEAQTAYRRLLQRNPGYTGAKFGLASVLFESDRAPEAETLLLQARNETQDPRMLAGILNLLAVVQRKQRKNVESLASIEKLQALDPSAAGLDFTRAEILLDLKRFDDALAIYGGIIARTPTDPAAHHAYNSLLYRLGRDTEFLVSYDKAPPTPPLQMDKGAFLTNAKRHEEAYRVYANVLAHFPGDKHAAAGAGTNLFFLKQHDAAEKLFEQAIAQNPDDQHLHVLLSTVLLQKNDPQKAEAIAAQGLTLDPLNQLCIAVQGTAWRLMGDERDEILNGYDTLIRAFDLEPPKGFSDMESFNQELRLYLEALHPRTREYLEQSLRGGTQTPNHLFGAGHDLVDRLQTRISETISRYVAELPQDARHPFTARRANGFRYSGSWSSRLADCGFHVNHVHPGGWISSCYYVALPDAVQDTEGKQGWIKFGEPSFETALANPMRRAIEPAPGRLVLFPSYMWHGTIPFRSEAARTTIAFDAVPE